MPQPLNYLDKFADQEHHVIALIPMDTMDSFDSPCQGTETESSMLEISSGHSSYAVHMMLFQRLTDAFVPTVIEML